MKLDPSKFHYGAVTPTDWKILVESLESAESAWRSFGGCFIEIGTLSGATTVGIFRVLLALGISPELLTIDKSPEVKESIRTRKWILEKDGINPNGIKFHAGKSRDVLGSLSQTMKVAWAFIDGCHCEGCVSWDIRGLAPRIVPGGILAFHDAGNQRELGMLVHERYHDHDEIRRLYGVTEAIKNCDEMADFEFLYGCPASPRPAGSPTPVRGGVQVFKKRTWE